MDPPKMSTSNPWNLGFYGVRSLLNGFSELFGYYLGFGKNSNKPSAKFHMPLGKEQLLFFLPGPGFWKQLSPFHVSPAGMHLDGVSQTRPSLITTPSLGLLHQCPCWAPWPNAGSSSLLCQGRCSHQNQALIVALPWVTQHSIASHQSSRAEYISLENTKSHMRGIKKSYGNSEDVECLQLLRDGEKLSGRIFWRRSQWSYTLRMNKIWTGKDRMGKKKNPFIYKSLQ